MGHWHHRLTGCSGAVQQTNDLLLHGPAALCSTACYPSSKLAVPGAGLRMSSLSGTRIIDSSTSYSRHSSAPDPSGSGALLL